MEVYISALNLRSANFRYLRCFCLSISPQIIRLFRGYVSILAFIIQLQTHTAPTTSVEFSANKQPRKARLFV